jgi:hypothetical protein
VLVFIDDILIYSPTLQDHVQRLRQVFTVLRKHQFFLKRKKCAFAEIELQYLGHIISQKGVATDPSKTEAMVKWHVPTYVTKLRGFLGLIGYYKKFVRHYGTLVKPLTRLLQGKRAWLWTDEAHLAFEKLKHAMTHTPVLALPRFDMVFAVEIDACDEGIGAVLMQENKPLAFLSKALELKNKQLSIYEEFLALIIAVDRWRPYLQRSSFTIMTDHQSLSFLGEQQLQSELQRKAMAKLMGLQFKIVYKKGLENVVANALSRVGAAMTLALIYEVQPVWLQEVLNSYGIDV